MRVVSFLLLFSTLVFADEISFRLVRRSGSENPETYEIRCSGKKDCTVARTRPSEEPLENALPRAKAVEWLRTFFKSLPPTKKPDKKSTEELAKQFEVPFKEHDLMVQWDAQLNEKSNRGYFLRSEVGQTTEEKRKALLAVTQIEGQINRWLKK